MTRRGGVHGDPSSLARLSESNLADLAVYYATLK
jgi:hypothetical protein